METETGNLISRVTSNTLCLTCDHTLDNKKACESQILVQIIHRSLTVYNQSSYHQIINHHLWYTTQCYSSLADITEYPPNHKTKEQPLPAVTYDPAQVSQEHFKDLDFIPNCVLLPIKVKGQEGKIPFCRPPIAV